ncbi:MAG TPA: tRNA-(ms[2]io[6]A)-hydroxylase [Bacteroidia bacterium]|nr:tRNA-(ms[2]io[6]A)-hydroxylase [Bacteroidia bacterium]
MLGLKLATDLRWVNIVEKDIAEILTDHAWCEQKAASTAISLTVHYPEHLELVIAMIDLAQEELLHFKMVVEKLEKRGLKLGRERKDNYVNDLLGFVRKGGDRRIVLLDKLLFSAMIEARSCERFRLLAENISDNDLKSFYRDLMESEAGHYRLFISFARKFADKDSADKRWQEFLDFEAHVVSNYGKTASMHG